MGTSGVFDTKGIDESVGGLVWVQRRNGSWWPGRIMGLDELSGSSLVSPKSGTPLKLLCRDDACVDWYNLEKSKRVKAFRCGDYDECIEKAKASAECSIKKAVKYTRRGDAILHALEIERRFLSDQRENANRVAAHSSRENEDMAEEMSCFEENSNVTQDLSQSSLSFEEPNGTSPSKVQSVHKKRQWTPNDSEDDGPEKIKRMRGLKDLGLGVVTESKTQAGRDPDPVQQGTPAGNHLNGSTGDSLSLNGKRSLVANVLEFFKRKKRCRPLTKILEIAAWVSVPIMYDELAKVSGLETYTFKRGLQAVVNDSSESTGTSCENGLTFNATEVGCDCPDVHATIKDDEILSTPDMAENACADTLFDVLILGEESHTPGFHPIHSSSSSGKPQGSVLQRQCDQNCVAETSSLKNERPTKCFPTSCDSIGSQITGRGASKWESKGKRKSRHSIECKKPGFRKFMFTADREYTNGFSLGSAESNSQGITDDLFRFHPKHQQFDFLHGNCVTGSLYDVNLNVKVSYRPQHVPLVSITSKLNGKAIVGHHLTVEALSDGSLEYLMDGFGCHLHCSSFDINDGLSRGLETSKLERPGSRKSRCMFKKIRTLSSLSASRMQGHGERKLVEAAAAAVSCIPVKLVFSRLKEALNSGPAHAL